MEYLPLMSIFEGYVRNYRRLNLNQATNRSMFTKREIDYFANLGEMLGLFPFVEDYKPNLQYGRSRPMDLSWWKWDQRVDPLNFTELVLHLERENLYGKDTDTLEKLFAETEPGYVPHNVIGIQNVEHSARIQALNTLVKKKNRRQKSEVLMIYRYYDAEAQLDRIEAHYFDRKNNPVDCRKAVSQVDQSGYWFMSLEEEFYKKHP
jgi:hypothetical protein